MSNESFSLHGKRALITGGGSGIGYAIAAAFVAAGARVVLTGRSEDTLTAAAAALGECADYRVHDVTDGAAAMKLVASLEADGGIDILVNNAGRHDKRPALEMDDAATRTVMETNLMAVMELSRHCAAGMSERGEGSILMVSSMAAMFGIPQVTAYSAAKSAVGGLVRQLAVEWGPLGIRVNCIAPGFIDTAMSRSALERDPNRKRRILERTPLGRLGTADEVGGAAVYLSSDAGRFVTGITLPVDGGVSVGF